MNSSPRHEFLAGAQATLPLIVGAIPFGIIFGTLAQTSGLSAFGAIAMPQGSLWLDWRNPWLMAGGIAAVVAWVRKDLLTTIIVGMVSFALLRWLVN
ncbi:AzlD domain-containing protein [Nitrincola tibetensis]|nr:AzlD domain-containing protein [Nitrincola tibetensis]